MEFMPQNAPLVVLTFLGTCFAFGVLGIAVVYGLVRGKPTLVKYALAAALAGAGLYAGLLLTASWASREKVLGLGEQKYFCEIDCHVAYSVVEVAAVKALGTPPHPATAAGNFYVVKVKTLFDEKTISARRGYAPLTPGSRRVVVVDERGREFFPSPEGSRALEQARGGTPPLTQPLRPGESYSTEFVFDLPADVSNPWLFLTNADSVTQLLIGHENSPFHKKIFFRLGPQSTSAAGFPERESLALRGGRLMPLLAVR